LTEYEGFLNILFGVCGHTGTLNTLHRYNFIQNKCAKPHTEFHTGFCVTFKKQIVEKKTFARFEFGLIEWHPKNVNHSTTGPCFSRNINVVLIILLRLHKFLCDFSFLLLLYSVTQDCIDCRYVDFTHHCVTIKFKGRYLGVVVHCRNCD
jgi:hypothetical protein